MTFKFVARNNQTGKTGSVTVRADRETVARQKLQLSGYEIVRLVRVTNGQENQIKFAAPTTATVARRAVQSPSRRMVLKIKLGALVHDILSPFALFS